MNNHEIMTLEEVAEYVRVSERTVYEWAQKGEIPGGKLGTSWRFKRSEIERWIDSRLAGSSSQPVAPAPVDLGHVLSKEHVLIGDCMTKTEALDQLIDCMAETGVVRDRQELAEGIYRREALMSTGIGMGVAVPHIRLSSVSSVTVAALGNRHPIHDYESLDGGPVRLVFMIVAGRDQHALYIKLLSSISSRIKNRELRDHLLSAETPESFHHILTTNIG